VSGVMARLRMRFQASVWACVVAVVPLAAGCATDDDCSLNGVCTSGACVCDVAWGSTDCSALQLVPPSNVTPAYVRPRQPLSCL
jgi:hypothetical protein